MHPGVNTQEPLTHAESRRRPRRPSLLLSTKDLSESGLGAVRSAGFAGMPTWVAGSTNGARRAVDRSEVRRRRCLIHGHKDQKQEAHSRNRVRTSVRGDPRDTRCVELRYAKRTEFGQDNRTVHATPLIAAAPPIPPAAAASADFGVSAQKQSAEPQRRKDRKVQRVQRPDSERQARSDRRSRRSSQQQQGSKGRADKYG